MLIHEYGMQASEWNIRENLQEIPISKRISKCDQQPE